MSLARRTVSSISWNALVHPFIVTGLFVRAILLARWLPVEVFGVYGFALAIVDLSRTVLNFGMTAAFRHRALETENEEQTAAVYFTMTLLLTAIWSALLIIFALIFADHLTKIAIVILTLSTGGIQLVSTPKLLLVRRVLHRRLVLADLAVILSTTLVALGLAWWGIGLGALLSIDLVTLVVVFVVFYIWKPVWRPRIAWSWPIVRYFFQFGSFGFISGLLWRALDRVDDLWIGIYLGKVELGFYSRAYMFATAPRGLVAAPINAVAGGVLAELKGDRLRQSQAFFRFTALLVRSGFLLAGLLFLLAPEFISLLLGD